MEKTIKKICSPELLNPEWDSLADSYFQKKEFLIYLQKYNPCSQRYYELYHEDKLAAGTVAYTLTVNLLTFTNLPSPVKMQIIGLPISLAAPPMIGNKDEFEYFLSELIRLESGLIVGINFMDDYLKEKVINLRTLPTIIFKPGFNDLECYIHSLRYPYRRRIHKIRPKFTGVEVITTECSEFNEEHYAQYLDVMRKTTTKLETIGYDLFRNLPSNFRLTTCYSGQKMLCWHILCEERDVMTYFMGGMNYSLRNQYQSYNNNLYLILETAINQHFRFLNLGQTAEIAKLRLGGELSERRLFLYHKNPVIFALLKLFKNTLAYNHISKQYHVFREETAGKSIDKKLQEPESAKIS